MDFIYIWNAAFYANESILYTVLHLTYKPLRELITIFKKLLFNYGFLCLILLHCGLYRGFYKISIFLNLLELITCDIVNDQFLWVTELFFKYISLALYLIFSKFLLILLFSLKLQLFFLVFLLFYDSGKEFPPKLGSCPCLFLYIYFIKLGHRTNEVFFRHLLCFYHCLYWLPNTF